MILTPPPIGESSAPAVRYRAVTFAYPSDPARPAVESITLDVSPGERLGILGPNGGGKSTLIKLTLGLLAGFSGEISIFGLSPREAVRRRIMGYVPQRSEAELAFPISGREAVTMAATLALPPWRLAGRAERDSVDEALAFVSAADFADRPVGTLSGGQLQRIAIARSLVCRPRLLLLDEPTVGIDVAGQQQFGDLLSRLSRDLGLTIMVVSHDLRTIAAGCDRVACLSRTLHSHGEPRGLTPAVLAEVFRHDVAAIFGDLHVDAHSAAACRDPSHSHERGPA